MAEDADVYPQSVCSEEEEERPESDELCKQRFQWVPGSCNSKVATVRPVPRKGNSDSSLLSASPSSSSAASLTRPLTRSSSHAAAISPAQPRQTHTERLTWTRLQPFSFDERDSVQRVAREKRLEELRHMEESLLTLATRFKANPVRKYKPLVLKQSARPLTVPRDPFSRQDSE